MDAIPSLCASSASCGAAGIGYVFGQPLSLDNTRLDGRRFHADSFEALSDPNPANASSPSSPRIETPRLRNRPVSNPGLGHIVTEQGNSAAIAETSQEGVRGTESDIFAYEGIFWPSEDIGASSRSQRAPWLKRLSNIPASVDGSSISSPTLRPGTPSLLSNGSRAPFIPSTSTVVPRNRLVKRSASQRILQSAYPVGSPFSSSTSTPTLRRPATSHQRSEQFRIHELSQEPASQNSPVLDEQGGDQILGSRVPLGINESSPSDWKPFFQSRIATLGRESSRLAEKISGAKAIKFVKVQPECSPVLVMSPLAHRLSNDRAQQSQQVQTPKTVKTVSSSGLRGEGPGSSNSFRKSRQSFAISDFLPSTSPTVWRRRSRRSLDPNLRRQEEKMSKRAVSAPLKRPKSGEEIASSSSIRGDGKRSMTHSALSPSPISPLDRVSAFEVDALTTDPAFPSTLSPRFRDSTQRLSSGPSIGKRRVISHPSTRIGSGGSYGPSDFESTESDNDHSHLFSTEGDDTDYRSDTLYDSIRTEATSSSHSGAKDHHVETLFNRSSVSDRVLSSVEEQLSTVALDSPGQGSEHNTENAPQTPVGPVRVTAEDDPTPSNKPAKSPLGSLSSSPLAAYHKTPKRTKNESSSDESVADDRWPPEGDESWVAEDLGISVQPRPSSASQVKPSEGSSKPNIFDWSERNPADKEQPEGLTRPKTAFTNQNQERGGRSLGRRGPSGVHYRSKSVPLPPDNSNHRLNKSTKPDPWILGGKGVSEDWDGDFDFGESSNPLNSESRGNKSIEKTVGPSGVVVPRSIMETQASVHGQFGQVKELTLLVEELKRLHRAAEGHGILNSQSSELWKEAEGIVDLATVDEEPSFSSQSPHSTSFDFDAFDEDASLPRRRRSSASPLVDDVVARLNSQDSGSSQVNRASPPESKFGSSQNRPRKESAAKVKHVLDNIHQHRSSIDLPSSAANTPPRRLPFDTTSLRDLVTRAGVVTRACKEIIRRIEDPNYVPTTPERRPGTPPDPPFSQIFQQPSPSIRMHSSPRTPIKRGSEGFSGASPGGVGGGSPKGSGEGGPSAGNDNDFNGHIKIMTVA